MTEQTHSCVKPPADEARVLLDRAKEKPPRHVYTYICEECGHRSHQHTLREPGGDLLAGPYDCEECDCSIPQGGPAVALSRQQSALYDRLTSSRG